MYSRSFGMLLVCFLLSLLILSLTINATQLITNPGFETGTFSGWTTTGNLFVVSSWGYNPLITPNSGTEFAVLEGPSTTGTLSQGSIGIVPGTNYALSFYLFKEHDGSITGCTYTLSGPSLSGTPVTIPGCTTITGGAWRHVTTTVMVPPGTGPDTFTLSYTFTDNTNVNASVALDDVTLEGAASIVGDPQFIGLRGQKYQIHGIDGAVYNLISDATMQFNARFVFLGEGRCPTIGETHSAISPLSNCFSHSGSYIGELGFQQIVGKEVSTIFIKAGPAAIGFSSVKFNGKELQTGQINSIETFSLNYTASHTIIVQTSLFSFEFDNSDNFINQRFTPNVRLSTLKAHGLIGQTSRVAVNPGLIPYIEGEVDDYVIVSDNILGNDFMYNRFTF